MSESGESSSSKVGQADKIDGAPVAPAVPRSAELAVQLNRAARQRPWDAWTEFEWPESLGDEAWSMSPELVSLHGTEIWERLDDSARKRLALYEAANLFSVTLHGEKSLVGGLGNLLYEGKTLRDDAADFVHHFIDEENKHMVMFGQFCRRYVGKVYPEKKLILPRDHVRGEAEVMFLCKVLVVEELGDYYNVAMQHDERLHPIVRHVHRRHHLDEVRHIGFGRTLIKERWDFHSPKWPAHVADRFRAWLWQFIDSTWGDLFNPTMYRDAGLTEDAGFPSALDIRELARAAPHNAALRARASKKLIDYLVRHGLLTKSEIK